MNPMSQRDPDPARREERLDQVIAGFLDEVESNAEVDRRQWLVRYPEFFDELSDFFADRDEVERLAGPFRNAARSADRVLARDWLEPSNVPDYLGRLATYEVLGWVGQGGMGVVFKGFDAALNRFVAIKVLAPQWSADPSARRRFTREAQAAAAISHPHVITIHAVGEWRERPFLVMEFVPGGSLQQRIDAGGPLELKELLRIGVQVASGLAAAHAQGLIHRDIKPSNIMLENELARVKITDFGLARAVDDTRLTLHGTLAGTPPYMAPEQARGEPMDRRADLFSLGSVLYAMATGRAAFRGESTVAVIRRVCDGQPTAIRELNPDIPDWLAEIIERLHAKEPGQRFQSAGEVTELLERHLARLQDPSLPPVEHPWRGRPSRLAMIGRDLARRAGAGRLAIPLLLLAVAAGSAAWTRWALQVPPAATDPAPRLSDRLKAAWEYRCDFRDGRYDYRWLHLEPNGPLASLAKPDRRGLRIAIPPRTDCSGVGAFTLFGVHGDFEVTASFEILRADRPREGDGVGPELYLRAVDGWDHYASMARMLRAEHAEPQLRVAWGEKGDGRPRSPGARDRTDLKAGRFRIARAGSTIHYLVAAKGSDAFREVAENEFGTGDLNTVRLMALVNGSEAALDVLWADLTIRAESLPGFTDGRPPEPQRASWWLLLAGLSGVTALGIGAWWIATRRDAMTPATTKARVR
jgi:hypothetical protein